MKQHVIQIISLKQGKCLAFVKTVVQDINNSILKTRYFGILKLT